MYSDKVNQIITNIYNNCIQTAVPCISIPTQLFIDKLLHDHKPKRYLEIGSADGFSLCSVADTISTWGGTAIGCERGYPNWSRIQQNISLLNYYGLDNLECIYGSFIDRYIDIVGCKFDMVFLDGQKSEYGTYLKILVDNNMIDSQTIVLIDDVIKYKDKMKDLYDMISGSSEWSSEIYKLDEDDGVIVLKCGAI